MNDQEIDLMDELYFVQAYDDVKSSLNWKDEDLQKHFFALYQRDFIKLLVNHDEEYNGKNDSVSNIPWEDLYYLATKKGLLEHNGF